MSVEVERRVRELSAAALLGLVMAAGHGCMPLIPYQSGAQVPQARVAGMQPGKTTKYELLESFGMPLAIARKGEAVVIQRGKEHRTTDPRGAIDHRFEYVSADVLFEPFSESPTGAQHRVYYYGHTISSKRALSLLVYNKQWTEKRSDELWVLVDEQNGIVEDFLFRPGATAK